ncbi:MAG: hypothetical protein WB760_00170 [Xanthobacteraceae bacterium]
MLENDNQKLAEAVPAVLEQCQEVIYRYVAPYIERYAKAARLERATPQFHRDVAKAILWCLVEQRHTPSRKRYSDIRRELLSVSKAAAKTAKAFNSLRSALNTLTPVCHEPLEPYLPKNTADTIARLNASAHLGGKIAEKIKDADKGGRPRMFAFEILIRVS